MSLKRISSCWEPRLWKTGESLPSDSVNLIHIYQIPSKFDWLVYNSSTDVIQTFDFKVGNLEEANRVVTKPFQVQYSFVKFRMQMQITLSLEGTVDRVGSKCLRPVFFFLNDTWIIIWAKKKYWKNYIVVQHDIFFIFFTKYVWITLAKYFCIVMHSDLRMFQKTSKSV